MGCGWRRGYIYIERYGVRGVRFVWSTPIVVSLWIVNARLHFVPTRGLRPVPVYYSMEVLLEDINHPWGVDLEGAGGAMGVI